MGAFHNGTPISGGQVTSTAQVTMTKQLKNRITLQCIFNILTIVFVVLISLGLWSCMLEIHRLNSATKALENNYRDLLYRIDTGRPGENVDYVRGQSETYQKESAANKNNGQDSIVNKRKLRKRATLATYETYDPLSSDQKSSEDFCWTLLYERCSGYIAAAPSLGPPGPPGLPGPKGDPGVSGIMGHMGPPGVNGQKGQKGHEGKTGRVGEPGADGPRGPRGLPGDPGLLGHRGKRGAAGAPGPPGRDGIPGMPGMKGDKGEWGDPGPVYTLNGNNCTCKGEKGEKGKRGLVGFNGFKGEPGIKGEPGYGVHGYKGEPGRPGSKGEKGDTGYCHAFQCGDKYVRRTATPPLETTTPSTTSTTTTTPTTTPTIPPSLAPRTIACRVKQVGTPTFVTHDVSVFGAFLSDPLQREKYWIARGYYGQYLEEYHSFATIKKRSPDRRYRLSYSRYHGTQHAIYNNSFYYHFTGQQHVVVFDLSLQDVVTSVPVPKSHYNDSVFLYEGSNTYYDIVVDESGLWVIFGRTRGNETKMHVMKVDRQSMLMERVWKLPFDVGTYRNGFIACGILYLASGVPGRATEASFSVMYDLYTDEMRTIDVRFKVPFHRTTMLSFYSNTSSRKYSELLVWDNGNLIKYPMLF